MKKMVYAIAVMVAISSILQGCGSKNEIADHSHSSEVLESNITENRITEEMAYDGVYNYCHDEFDWSIAEDNPSIMYVTMGEELETEYQVIFRSYTGAFLYFYVNKSDGTTRIEEYVPTFDIRNEQGTIDLYDYLKESD